MNNYNLPSKYLSYSACTLWNKDKPEYRRRYYEKQPGFTSPYTIFGKEVHQLIEDGKLAVKDHPHDLYTNEMRIYTHIEDVPVLGYIDLIREDTYALSDIKTSINEWTQVTTEKLLQLPWYQLLIRNKYGKCSSWARVVWLETEWRSEKKGIGSTRHLALTGKQEVFHRRTNKHERDTIRDMIVRTAQEVSDDYTYWLTNNNHG